MRIDEAARILKTGKRKTIKAFAEVRDVLALLPTAYGKSLYLSPTVFDHKMCLAEKTSMFMGLVISISVDDRPNQLLYRMRLMARVRTISQNGSN